MDLVELLKQDQEYVEKIINKNMPIHDGENERLVNAINYAISSGGKRIRPILMLETFKMLSYENPSVELEAFMFSLEAIHAYSLVHDDLPAMDNAQTRRGKPCVHIKFDEATAILVGDALLNLSMETVLGLIVKEDYHKKIVSAMSVLFGKSGINGMIGGQALDLEYANSQVSIEQLNRMNELKTCALIEAAVLIGGILAGIDGHDFTSLKSFGYLVGLIFQITDDLLDYDEDKEAGRSTYATILGYDEAQKWVKKYIDDALSTLYLLPVKNHKFMQEFITYLGKRTF